MQKKFYSLLALILFFGVAATAQTNSGTLMGKVKDKDTGEPLSFATVIVYLNGNTVNGGSADIDGKYSIKPLEPGSYDVSVQSVGYKTYTVKGVVINSSRITTLPDIMLVSSTELGEVEVVDYKVPLIDRDGGPSGGTVTREELKNMPGRDALGFAATVAGATNTGNGISIRGAREGSTWVYIDGIKVRGSSALPKSAIEEVSVLTGGIPANIGDVTGGVVNISLRNSSKFYTGGLEFITSGFKSGTTAYGLDRFGYNLVEGSLSGPLLFKKDENGEKGAPLLGFFLSGSYTNVVDGNPNYGGNYRITDEARERLYNNPLRPNFNSAGDLTGVLYSADFLTKNDFTRVPTRMNVGNQSANLVAKIDVNLNENVTLTFGGTGAFSRGHGYSYGNSLINWDNNQLGTSFDWRAYAKFSQRFRNATSDEEASASRLKNVFYSVMADYSKSYDRSEDDTHGDKLFRYGHVGNFDLIRGNTYEWTNNTYYRQTGVQDMHMYFTPSQHNPEAARVTSQYYDLFGSDPLVNLSQQYINGLNGGNIHDPRNFFLNDPNIIAAIAQGPFSSNDVLGSRLGLRNGDMPQSIYSLWNNLGVQNNGYGVSNNGQFRVSGMGSADIGDHALQIGFEFEQRKDAGYSVAPINLWQLARLSANSHIEKLDNQSVNYDSTIVAINQNGTTYYYTYFNPLVGENQTQFDYKLREALGLDPRSGDFINTDNMDPDFLDISMFSADELLNQGNAYVSYYGYDAYGNRLKGKKPTIDDFFNQTYRLGNQDNSPSYFNRGVGAFEPIYTAGYIMDKFAFDDLIFNVGVRVDRYDANQYIPKDPYVISEYFTAGEVTSLGNQAISHPGSIGNDYVVYVDDIKNPSSIKGYRNGNDWYNASGQYINDPTAVYSNGSIQPYLKVDPDAPLTSKAFVDYTPAVNIMPRIAFSFPISDEATFFAHYDVLTQRPTGVNRFNPIDYLYMKNRNVTLNNPNLKPERTVDYALGFQQVLTKSSSIKIEAFYRELRNMIQIRRLVGAYPSTYNYYDNIDFGTVKGLTLTYDLRRTGNIWIKASYTLQFADGTGSTTQSQVALINAGLPNLRTISPFNYDQRHRIVVTTDYRYGSGKDYNGPVWFNKPIFENTGANLIANLGSGTPYTPQVFATPVTGEFSPSTEGSINGARLPWQFTVDLNLDRNFPLTFGKDGEKKRAANLNVYLWVTNLLNTRNIIDVYRFTGTANEDGWLAASNAQQFINNQNSPAGYRNYYSMFVDDPRNYSNPRTIRLGIRFDF
jgi:hypothetical protein